MPADELDLENGRPDDAGGRKGGRTEESAKRQERRERARHRDTEAGIRERLHAIFSRLADAREGRGDVELAAMIREDSRAMVEGLLSVVRRAPGLAGVITGALAVLEPLIAFGRIARLLGGRFADRRAAAYEDAPEYVQPVEDEATPVEAPVEEETPTAQPWLLD